MAMTINGTEVTGISIGANEAIKLEIGGVVVWEKTNPVTELCMENLTSSSATFTAYKYWMATETYADLWYSIDDGTTWTDLGLNIMSRAGDAGGDITQTVTVPANGKIYLRGDNASGIGDSNQYVQFSMDASHNVSGSLLSIVDADDYATITPTLTKGFYSMFYGDTHLTSAENLVIGLASVPDYGMYKMFRGCTGLSSTADLSGITSIGNNGLSQLFYGCTLVDDVTAPNVSAWDTTKTANWLFDVAATGTVHKPSALTIPTNNTGGVPVGWTTADY